MATVVVVQDEIVTKVAGASGKLKFIFEATRKKYDTWHYSCLQNVCKITRMNNSKKNQLDFFLKKVKFLGFNQELREPLSSFFNTYTHIFYGIKSVRGYIRKQSFIRVP